MDWRQGGDAVAFVEGLRDGCGGDDALWMQKVDEAVQSIDWHTLPSLNSINQNGRRRGGGGGGGGGGMSSHVRNRSLVRFRCFIQDILDPEIFVSSYALRHAQTQQLHSFSGRYREDRIYIRGEFDDEMLDVGMADRVPLHCIIPPAEQDWVAEHANEISNNGNNNSNSNNNSNNSNNDDNDRDNDISGRGESSQGRGISGAKRNVENQMDESHRERTHLTMHLGCNVLVYGGLQDVSSLFKINDLVEFVGIYHNSRESLAEQMQREDQYRQGTNSRALAEEATDDQDDMMTETRGPSCARHEHNLYVLSHRRLPRYGLHPPPASIRQEVLQNLPLLRESVLSFLRTFAVQGDSLAAEYLLLHLLSHTHTRRFNMTLGRMVLNLRGVGRRHVKPLMQCLSLLLPRLSCIPLTIDTLNRGVDINNISNNGHHSTNRKNFLTPRKDYHTNRLQAGLLQLPNGTEIVIDETNLQEGQLTEVGVGSVATLLKLLQHQSVDYDFEYYPVTMAHDCPALILTGSGKTILFADVIVDLLPSSSPSPSSSSSSSPSPSDGRDIVLTEKEREMLPQLRRYIEIVQDLPFQLDESGSRVAEEDFTRTRAQLGAAAVTEEVFHYWLNLARLCSISYGHSSLTPAMWGYMRQLDTARQHRRQQSNRQ